MAYAVIALHLPTLQLYVAVAVAAFVGAYFQVVHLVASAEVSATTNRSNKDISRK